MTKKERLQNNLWYMREQIARYLYANYQIKPAFKFYANKELKKTGIYASTTFPDRKRKWDPIEIDVCYELMAGGKRKVMLNTAFKEAVRIGQWYREFAYEDGHPEFEEELRLRGITGTGGVAETGLELHQYGCSTCKVLYILKVKKLSKSKCPQEKGLLSMCCKAPIIYMGTKVYKNEVLQQIKARMDIEKEE